ncbi:MAG: sensor histidine kinase [Spirochaetaceae bacterium]|nr:MAG: sensor histidine kinase [Spirochaetaceae bacterium]
MKTSRSLFAQAFLVLLLSQVILVAGLSGVFVFAVQRSVESWNIDRGQQLQNLLIPEISRVYRTHGRLPEAALHPALDPFITGTVTTYITNAAGQPVYLNVAGQQYSVHDTEVLHEQLRQLPEIMRSPAVILEGGRVVGYLYTDTRRFREDLTNRRLLQSLFTVALGGSMAALIGAFLVAILFSRLLARRAGELARGITELAGGSRAVLFPTGGPEELQQIARSAAILQTQLSLEEDLRRRWTEDIAHDLRTPVTALKTQLEGMTEGYIAVTPQRTELLFQEVLRIERLVTDLRELSTVESPEASLTIAPVDPVAFTTELRSGYRASSREQGVEFVVDAGGGPFPADEHLLRRAVGNVLDNAFRHASGPAPRVVLRTRRDRSGFWIEVANTGEIDEAELPRVFDRFYRGQNATGTQGSGLGLSIARAIVMLHRGSIGMTCGDGVTTVRVRLPPG